MNDAWDVAQYRQENVDEEVCIASTLKEDSKRWDEDGENDLANVAVRHKLLARV